MEGGSRGARMEEGATRKRKKETMGRLSPKKRKMDSSQVRGLRHFYCTFVRGYTSGLYRRVKPLGEVKE